ncbi:SSI family serine proteinase inhibitor [Streptomyces marincola]|uniref:Subtilisin inhibitor domain-containing protein n=1 Tax=Streptomyces marincola TaxID=2878388 RepID=A0A1W7CXY4_9ACTN|nr:SSI family serine proteinase inhibitor [Streptomyces marincola]ARQ69668.1 hypothetical protein CAG99_13035 [Streptomyces marincola]
MLHKSLAAALVLAATAALPASAAGHAPADEAAGRLLITVVDSGTDADGTHELTCGPAGGDHADPAGACAALERAEQPFEAVERGTMCTYVHGGPATAEIEGVWNGERVRAEFSRADGCEIARWDALVPALPDLGV